MLYFGCVNVFTSENPACLRLAESSLDKEWTTDIIRYDQNISRVTKMSENNIFRWFAGLDTSSSVEHSADAFALKE